MFVTSLHFDCTKMIARLNSLCMRGARLWMEENSASSTFPQCRRQGGGGGGGGQQGQFAPGPQCKGGPQTVLKLVAVSDRKVRRAGISSGLRSLVT